MFCSKIAHVLLCSFLAFGMRDLLAADEIFSGPQPGEKTTGFKVAGISGATSESERDPIADNKGAPIALVFLHGLERSLVPLLRVVDEYGALRKDKLRTEVIFLAPDRITGEQRMKAAVSSLKLKSNVGVSLDGIEGPGNYGLNKECLMTIVIARDNKVTANFALVQPGIADAAKVVAALAKAAGDDNPPSVETLNASRNPPMMSGREARKRIEGQEAFPGAVPTDERLTSYLRQFIRKTNDEATVDKVLADVRVYIKDNDDLRQQAVNGWTRVLHFGDRYGTPYAQKKGAEFLEELKKK